MLVSSSLLVLLRLVSSSLLLLLRLVSSSLLLLLGLVSSSLLLLLGLVSSPLLLLLGLVSSSLLLLLGLVSSSLLLLLGLVSSSYRLLLLRLVSPYLLLFLLRLVSPFYSLLLLELVSSSYRLLLLGLVSSSYRLLLLRLVSPYLLLLLLRLVSSSLLLLLLTGDSLEATVVVLHLSIYFYFFFFFFFFYRVYSYFKASVSCVVECRRCGILTMESGSLLMLVGAVFVIFGFCVNTVHAMSPCQHGDQQGKGPLRCYSREFLLGLQNSVSPIPTLDFPSEMYKNGDSVKDRKRKRGKKGGVRRRLKKARTRPPLPSFCRTSDLSDPRPLTPLSTNFKLMSFSGVSLGRRLYCASQKLGSAETSLMTVSPLMALARHFAVTETVM